MTGTLKSDLTGIDGEAVDLSGLACKEQGTSPDTASTWALRFFEDGATKTPISDWEYIYETPCKTFTENDNSGAVGAETFDLCPVEPQEPSVRPYDCATDGKSGELAIPDQAGVVYSHMSGPVADGDIGWLPGTRIGDDAGMTSLDEAGPIPTRWTKSTVYRDMWVDPDHDPRETDAEAVDERSTLLEYLRYYRLTLEMKCAGLDAAQLARRSVPPSTMSLLGLVRHLAEGERHFRRVMAGADAPKLYCTAEDRDGDWNGAVADPAVVEDAWRQWRAEVELADQFVAGVADLGSRNAGVSDLGPDGAGLQLRDALVAQIVEYARHCGHADLLRERIDGRVGQ